MDSKEMEGLQPDLVCNEVENIDVVPSNVECSQLPEIPSSSSQLAPELNKKSSTDKSCFDSLAVDEIHVLPHIDTDKQEKVNENTSEKDMQRDEVFEENQPKEKPILIDDFVATVMGDAEDGLPDGGEICFATGIESSVDQAGKVEVVLHKEPLEDPINIDDTNSTSKQNNSGGGTFVISACTEENVTNCMECNLPRNPKYLAVKNKEMSYICDDKCLKAFKEKYAGKVVFNSESDFKVKNLLSGVKNDDIVAEIKCERKCGECFKNISNIEKNLSWQLTEFCDKLCLAKHLKRKISKCTLCQAGVDRTFLGKHFVRVGFEVQQFCGTECLDKYKKNLKVCSYCKMEVARGSGFLASVDNEDFFKDFCTEGCMKKYETTKCKQPLAKSDSVCFVCHEKKPITTEFDHDNKTKLFCGVSCFAAFKFINDIVTGKCNVCQTYCDVKILEENAMYYENAHHSFCSQSCKNLFLVSHRKNISCSWCEDKKYNFDMIRGNIRDGSEAAVCSIKCLNFYQAALNALNSTKTSCSYCYKESQLMYHEMRSNNAGQAFCSLRCVHVSKNRLTTPTIIESVEVPTSISVKALTKSMKRKREGNSKNPLVTSTKVTETTEATTSTENGTRIETIQKISAVPKLIKPMQEYIIKPLPLPPQRNVATMCKTVGKNKSISCKPIILNKKIQTDELPKRNVIVPIPVPIFVPLPMYKRSLPFPVPFPIPIPIPVPVFIPTDYKTEREIMKAIENIKEKFPADPLEAELLMMAEMVADNLNKDAYSFSTELSETNISECTDGELSSPELIIDDVPQVVHEASKDLENAPNTSTENGNAVETEISAHNSDVEAHTIKAQAARGFKRLKSPPDSPEIKRKCNSINQVEVPTSANELAKKPDADMCLKYTFGINAWKNWISLKNSQLEASSSTEKLFKSEILQLTVDELNCGLCLFVKDLRKPDGKEYSPDTIYYLCLSIQMYLLENGRIDNIFFDTYYEKFTECLDEVAKKFLALYNNSDYIVTRIKEEHLWESKQLGAYSPYVLLNTIMFFNTKYFNLSTIADHTRLSFLYIMRYWKRKFKHTGTAKGAVQKNSKTDKKLYELLKNEEDLMRSPLKLYEFYLSKCPESVKTRNDAYYLVPERCCTEDSPVWFSTTPLPQSTLQKMLHRIRMVKEVNVALFEN